MKLPPPKLHFFEFCKSDPIFENNVSKSTAKSCVVQNISAKVAKGATLMPCYQRRAVWEGIYVYKKTL